MTLSIVAICAGASLGALLRWFLGTKLNALFPSIPPGTLTANLVGGYLIGVAVAYFSSHPSLPPEWRLLIYSVEKLAVHALRHWRGGTSTLGSVAIVDPGTI